MKTIILSALLLICSFCKGQEIPLFVHHGGIISSTGELKNYEDSCHCKLGTTSVVYGEGDKLTMSVPIYDTVKVEMIVTSTDEQNNKVVKIIGYEVGSNYHNYDCGNCPEFWNHIEYLDIVKKPLKNIHVWIANKLK